MTNYNPPHEARDEKKLAGLIEAIRLGETLPPIVVNGVTALTGSHRIEAYRQARLLADDEPTDAWDNANLDLATVEVSDEQYMAARDALGFADGEEIGDCNAFCAALYDVCDDTAVRAALADQR